MSFSMLGHWTDPNGITLQSWSQIHPSQTQRVGNDRHRTEGHRRTCPDRAYEYSNEWIEDSGRDRHTDRVVDEREKQVLADVPHRRAAQTQRAEDAAKIPLHQSDPRTLHRDVRAGPHRDPDGRFGKRGGVVDSVAGHRHGSPFRLKALND